MSNRIAIAIRVWLVGMLFAGAATLAVTVMLALGTGFSNPNPPLSFITMTAAPFLATAGVTKLMAPYVSRASNGAFHAGPMVLGVAAGFLAGGIVYFVLDANAAAGFVLIAVAGPISGALLGTLVNVALRPFAAGAAIAALFLILTIFVSGGLN